MRFRVKQAYFLELSFVPGRLYVARFAVMGRSSFRILLLMIVPLVLGVLSCGPVGTQVEVTGDTPPIITGSCSSGPTSAAAKIFIENPKIASGNNSLLFTANLNSYSSDVTVDGLDGTCLLQNKNFRIISDTLYPDTIALPSNGLVFLPNDPRFQQVMAYHNANTLQKRVTSIGSDISALGMITIDAHCSVTNNAYFSPSSKKLCFGYINAGGGKKLWAADDADVIVHEAGHSINHTLSTTSILNSSGEAGAMDEAYADYWALTINQNPVISEWFLGALESIYSLTGISRNASDNHFYPGSMVYEIHDDSRVYSEVLWDLRSSSNLGTNKTDKLVATSLVLLPSTTRFKDGAQALQDAAALLGYSASDKSLITTKLQNKGLIRSDSAANLRLSTVSGRKTVYVIDDYTYTSQSGGNCNATLDVGETALVLVNLENPTGNEMGMGSIALTSVPSGISVATGGGVGEYFRLNANDDFVDTLNDSGVYKEDATVAASFLITASSAGNKNFTMSFTPMGGAAVNINFSLTVGSSAANSSCVNAALWP